jgi:phosphatidylcholine synthase
MVSRRNQQILAWAIHVYTMVGGIVGMFALYEAALGRTREAFLLLVLSMIIDATDGMMARRVKIREVLPSFDGAMVDNVIDMLTFVWVPVFIMWQEQLLPHPVWTIVPILAGLYAYGQADMKTDDNFFLGFPSYWNIVALYLFWLRPEVIVALLAIIIPAILTVIPTRYLYPSKNDYWWRTTWALGAVWFVMVIVLLLQSPPDATLVAVSLFYPAFYMGLSFYAEYQIRYRK